MNILLGICGSVAAVKGALLARGLTKRGHDCRVVLTSAGGMFITPLQINSLTQGPCYTDDDFFVESEIPLHVELAQWADIMVVAPITADRLARFRIGRADDLLSAVYVCFRGNVILVPAMHENMWIALSTQENVATLSSRGARFLGPYHGELSTGEVGYGRMAEPEEIISLIEQTGTLKETLRGKKILLSMGRTEEEIDPVRVITNRSSGRMGLALLNALQSLGADVYIVAGETSLSIPMKEKVERVKSGEEMYHALRTLLPQVDALIMVAAVSDFRPVTHKKEKIRRQKKLRIEFESTRDILRELSLEKKRGQIFVGFALEEGDLLKRGKAKMKEKKVEILVANRIPTIGSAFAEGVIISEEGTEDFKGISKTELAFRIIDWMVRAFKRR